MINITLTILTTHPLTHSIIVNMNAYVLVEAHTLDISVEHLERKHPIPTIKTYVWDWLCVCMSG